MVNGTTAIQVRNGQVLIDITDGSIKKIEFRKVVPTADEQRDNPIATWWHNGVRKWNKGWETSFYKPFMLSRWAYDDSTIGEWYGVGLVWFLVRLAVALLLGVFDLILTAIFLVAQLAWWFFGATGRNIVWGIAALVVILIGYLIWSDA